jgi:hypothetical protein
MREKNNGMLNIEKKGIVFSTVITIVATTIEGSS